jgi:hypothetical protein
MADDAAAVYDGWGAKLAPAAMVVLLRPPVRRIPAVGMPTCLIVSGAAATASLRAVEEAGVDHVILIDPPQTRLPPACRFSCGVTVLAADTAENRRSDRVMGWHQVAVGAASIRLLAVHTGTSNSDRTCALAAVRDVLRLP